jgi:prevent-host-death family protein
MTKVGVRKLKNQLSLFLARVKNGEVLAVTQRGREIAVLSPAPSAGIPVELTEMVSAGLASWKGGKPLGTGHPVAVRGKQVSSLIIEDRR